MQRASDYPLSADHEPLSALPLSAPPHLDPRRRRPRHQFPVLVEQRGARVVLAPFRPELPADDDAGLACVHAAGPRARASRPAPSGADRRRPRSSPGSRGPPSGTRPRPCRPRHRVRPQAATAPRRSRYRAVPERSSGHRRAAGAVRRRSSREKRGRETPRSAAMPTPPARIGEAPARRGAVALACRARPFPLRSRASTPLTRPSAHRAALQAAAARRAGPAGRLPSRPRRLRTHSRHCRSPAGH